MFNYSCFITSRICGVTFFPKEKEEMKPWVMFQLARVSTAILGRKPLGPTLEIDYQILEFG